MDKSTTYKGKHVDLTENHNNAAIKVHLLPEEKMREIGFTDHAEDRWFYFKTIHNFDISFSLTIPKDNPDDWRIDILDEDFLQPYDYQYMLDNGSNNNVAKLVEIRVEEQMKYLADNGIISGHEVGDYI